MIDGRPLPGRWPRVTNQKIDLDGGPRGRAGDGLAHPDRVGRRHHGIATQVGGTLCTKVPEDHPMRVVYEDLFQCNPLGDGDWDAPTLLYAVGDLPAAFTELGQGGAAVVNEQGGLSWEATSSRPHDLYVHVADQPALNARLEELVATG